MKQANYAPNRGDLVWLDFTPHAGHEQGGRRPGLILSPIAYNRRIKLALICPITSRAKGFPFEVPLPQTLKVSGVILADHVRNLDWVARRAEFAGKIPESLLEDVLQRIEAILRPTV